LELLRDDTRLHLGDQVLGVDAEDAVQPGNDQDDAAPLGERAAGEAAAGAPGKDRKALRIGQLQDGGDLLRRARVDHGVGEKFHLGGVIA